MWPAPPGPPHDGYEAEIGDWLERSNRFGPLPELTARIRATGRRAGIWVAPFLVGANSRVAREHPGWLVGGADGGHGWGQALYVLDVTHPEAAEHLTHVFRTLAADGFGYFKLDFIYAGAIAGRRHADADPVAAYRRGLELIRAGAGEDAVIVGCGAPLLPSIGLVDAMRVSPDIHAEWQPEEFGGDITQPGMRSALTTGRARAWMHGRWWVNDPDCLLVRPAVEQRERWAAHLRAYSGLAASSDPLEQLDERGLELTRELLRPSSPAPVRWNPLAGPDQGLIGAAAESSS
ncbi:glycoside hydrolase family 36 protein [Paeniglutamicibacter sp.]|uniref:glycoside hydrolase family 36 protein n=1 Tax=Paeniglutamicibacter sp. TaxID=1934391 RepID=UPI0039898E71